MERVLREVSQLLRILSVRLDKYSPRQVFMGPTLEVETIPLNSDQIKRAVSNLEEALDSMDIGVYNKQAKTRRK